MAKIQKGVNDLKTWCLNNGDLGQQLIQEWTGQCEDGHTYQMDEVTALNSKKFVWKCSAGHTWSTPVISRTKYLTKCLKCRSAVTNTKRIETSKTLKDWCLENGEFGQRLMREWTGVCEDGNTYPIDAVTFGSNKKFKWICIEHRHEWIASVTYRTTNKYLCNYCREMQTPKASLKDWCLTNGEHGKRLLSEWTGECEDGKSYSIDQVTHGVTKKFLWRCEKGHTWMASIYNRTKKQANCLKCRSQSTKSNKPQVSLKNWCAENSALGKLLASEWTGICEDGKIYELSSINIDDNRKFKWKCGNGHEWIATVNNRIKYKSTCSKCRVISETDNLEIWCKNNGEIGQRLIAEWTGECADGSHLEMRAVPRSSRLQFKWRCSKGHEWYQPVANRTSKTAWASRYGCPICGAKPPAYPVQVLYFSLRQIFPRAEANCSVLRTPENPKGIKFSIAIPEIPLCIDYLSREDMTITDGKCTQRYMEQDSKRKLCRSAKVKFIQIIEDATQKKEGIIPKRDKICFKPDPNNFDEQLKEVMTGLLIAIGQSPFSVNMDLAIHNAWLSVNGTVGYNESLAYLYPSLAQEWHPELNKYIKPNQAKPSLNKVIYWVCPNCGHGADGEWTASISLRVRNKSGCRKCRHNWFKTQQGLPQEYRGKYK